MYRPCLAICFSLALVWNIGCTPPPKGAAPAASVKGTANIDGKPIPTGEIHFGMMGVPPRVLKITDGTFSGQAPIGKNQVEVFIYAEGPPSEKYGGTSTKKNTTPEKYWGPNTSRGTPCSSAAAGPKRSKGPVPRASGGGCSVRWSSRALSRRIGSSTTSPTCRANARIRSRSPSR